MRFLDVDVAGLGRAETAARARALTAGRLRERIALSVRGEPIAIAPSLLFTLDRKATTAAVLASGRESLAGRAKALLSPLTASRAVSPELVPRPAARRRLTDALARFAEPPVPAGVQMRGIEPVVTPSQAGTRPDLGALLAALERRVAAGKGTVPVRFGAAPPAITDDAARAAADEARFVVSAPVGLTLEGRSIGQVTPERIARLLTFREHDGRLLVLIDESRLTRALDPTIAPFKRRAVNARFEVDGRRARVVPSKDGLGLDAGAAGVAILTAAHDRGDRTAVLALAPVPPELTTARAQGLGIRERMSSFTTEMGPSSANRIHNVHLMADYIDGTVVRPGTTFSFNEAVGPRTPERGFLEGQMIIGSLLVPSVGGGVCQTATTLFNNAFELGLPILERHNHSFYISHYPLGRDATVSWGGPDLEFRNDLKHAVLIKSSYTDSTLTFTFYGTDEGRRVTARTSEQTNRRSPTLTYALDPVAPRGSVRIERGSHQSGFDVTVHRTVTKRGEVVRKDAFTSHYVAVGDTAIYGPGRTIPGPYFVIPPT